MNKKVAIIGAGPSGLAQLRAFKSAEENGEVFLKLFVLKSKITGEGYGIIAGEQGLISMVKLPIVVCIAIFGLMAQKSA